MIARGLAVLGMLVLFHLAAVHGFAALLQGREWTYRVDTAVQAVIGAALFLLVAKGGQR